MEIRIERGCGLDVHQATVVACVLVYEGGKRRKVVRTFRTMHTSLLELRAWLQEQGIEHATMEGTGVYWRPVYEVLEGSGIELFLVNARHVKGVPGRKTDVNDAEWLATLLCHGLLRKSFVPAKPIRMLRDLSRWRRMLVQRETSEKNRTIKVLEMMGIKLASVASDVFGKSGREMLAAIARGTDTSDVIANLARGRLRAKLDDLKLALDVNVQEHHRLMLRDQLDELDRIARQIAQYDERLHQLVEPYQEQIRLLRSIDGIQQVAAIEIFAEIGLDLAAFPNENHFASWAGTCPGQHESAGKHSAVRRRRGNPFLQSILVEAALAATRKKATYLRDKYFRLKARRGSMRALFAIAHKLANAVFRVLTTKQPYRDLGEGYLDQRNACQVARHLVERLRRLGYDASNVGPLFDRSGGVMTFS